MVRCKKLYRVVARIGILCLGSTVCVPQESLGKPTAEQMANWPVPMYQGEELDKVREWEKTWAGTRINQDNIDKVKEFLSEQFYGMYSKPGDWGADELWFEIIPYRQIKPTPGQIVMTKKYAPTAKLDPNSRKAFFPSRALCSVIRPRTRHCVTGCPLR